MSNKIDAQSEVLFHFTLTLADGSIADSTKLHGKPAKLRMGDGSLTFAIPVRDPRGVDDWSTVKELMADLGRPHDNLYEVALWELAGLNRRRAA